VALSPDEIDESMSELEKEACFRDEVNVYSIPHSRMKRLAQMAVDKLKNTNSANASELLTTVKTLSRVFYEFKTHERIENECIMRRLQAKLKKLNIQNTAVCNCHKDDELSRMLKLFAEGIRHSTKSEADRIKYGFKLQRELEKFQEHFLPHMQEEEDIFQPLLVKYFPIEELRELKESVLKQHQMWNTMDNLDDLVNQYDEIPWVFSNGAHSSQSHKSTHSLKSFSITTTTSSSYHLSLLFDEKSSVDVESLYYDSLNDSSNPGCGYVKSTSFIEDRIALDNVQTKSSPRASPLHLPSASRLHSPLKTISLQSTFPYINLLPSEVLDKIFTYLTISDLCRVSQVCRQWNAVAYDAQLWLTLAPLVWISSLSNRLTRDASWQNIETFETDSQLTASVVNDDITSFKRWQNEPENCSERQFSLDLFKAQARVGSNNSDSSGHEAGIRGVEATSLSGSSQKSNSEFRREQAAIVSIACHLVPRIGTRVTKLVLAGSQSVTNVLLRRILHCIPNVIHLDVRDTRIGNAAFRSLNRHGTPSSDDLDETGVCLGRLRYLNLAGCHNLTDEGLHLLIATVDGALTRLDLRPEPSLSAIDHRHEETRSHMSIATDISSPQQNMYRGLVMTEDQMMNLRKQKPNRSIRSKSSCSAASVEDLRSSDFLTSCECNNCPVEQSCGLRVDCDRSETMTSGKLQPFVEARMVDRPETLLKRPLEYIGLSGCYHITDKGLGYLSKSSRGISAGLPFLRHLDLSGCMNISVDGLLPLLETCPFINFTHLFYCDNVVLGDGIDDLASGCRNLQRGGNRVCCRSGL